MERGEEEGGLVVRGRVEIDMRPPFRSVKEAVLLFGEKVLAGEVYANKLKEMDIKEKNGKYTSKTGAADQHVKPTKQESVEKAKEESDNLMVQCLYSLRQELEQTKMELQLLKSRESHIEKDKQSVEREVEELKFIENNSTTHVKTEIKQQTEEENDSEFEKKRSVKFASPPLLTRVITSKDDRDKIGEQTLSPKKETKDEAINITHGRVTFEERKKVNMKRRPQGI